MVSGLVATAVSLGREGAGELVAALRKVLSKLDTFDEASIEGAVRGVAEARGIGAGPAIHTTRLALTGRTKGPGLFELMAVLGRERVVRRLERAEGCVGGAG